MRDRLSGGGRGRHHHHGHDEHGSEGGRGRFRRHEHGMRKGKLLSSDELHLVILQLLSEKPNHGYEIIKEIEQHSSGIYAPSPGMIYPVLTYIEEAGHATSKMDGAKKLFEVTNEGKSYLAEHKETVDTVLDHLKTYGERMASFEKQMARDEMVGERWGGGERGREGFGMKMEFHEVRHDLRDALFDKREAPIEEKRRVLTILKNAIAEIKKSG